MKIKKVLGRIGITILITIVFVLVATYATVFSLAHGPSETVRDMLVRAAIQASATKWAPGLFLDQGTIDQIMEDESLTESIPIADLIPPTPKPTPVPSQIVQSDDPTPPPPPADPWDTAPDGMMLEIFYRSTFKGYALLIKDPSRVFTATCTATFGPGRYGDQIFDIVSRGIAVAATNAGGFDDPEGHGHGGTPLGLTYSGGKCLWEDGLKLTFIGFDSNDRLVVSNSMTRAEADELGIRDAVSFQRNKMLINTVDGDVCAYYAEQDSSLAQRTAIGQAADGTVILMVTEGRTAAYLGASRHDIIDAMLDYGAVTAAMLDGGSSAMLCYPNYYLNYEYDETNLNTYQKMGLVNSYRAFTPPRPLPTFWAVKP